MKMNKTINNKYILKILIKNKYKYIVNIKLINY